MNSKSLKESFALCRGSISSLCSRRIIHVFWRSIPMYVSSCPCNSLLLGAIYLNFLIPAKLLRFMNKGMHDLFAESTLPSRINFLYEQSVSGCALTWLPADIRSELQFLLGAGGRRFGYPGQPAPPAETWCLSASRGIIQLRVVTKLWARVGHNKSTLFQSHRAVELKERPPGDHCILQANFSCRATSKYVAASSASAIGCLSHTAWM